MTSEAERRISFFASSLTTVLPEPLPTEAIEAMRCPRSNTGPEPSLIFWYGLLLVYKFELPMFNFVS